MSVCVCVSGFYCQSLCLMVLFCVTDTRNSLDKMQSASENQKINRHFGIALGMSIVKRRPQTIFSDSDFVNFEHVSNH